MSFACELSYFHLTKIQSCKHELLYVYFHYFMACIGRTLFFTCLTFLILCSNRTSSFIKALYDYDGSRPDVLSFRKGVGFVWKGSKISVTSESYSNSSWWWNDNQIYKSQLPEKWWFGRIWLFITTSMFS